MTLIEYLEEYSEKLLKLKNKIKKLNLEYRQTFDSDLRKEIFKLKKRVKTNESKVYELLYEKLEEIKLINEKFPKLMEFLISDEYIGHIIKKLLWLTKFKKKSPTEVEKELKEIKSQRKDLREIKEFIKEFTDEINTKPITATWDILKLKGKMTKREIEELIEHKDKELRKKGWLLLLNRSFIPEHLGKLFQKLKLVHAEEKELKKTYQKNKDKGTVAESEAKAEYDDAKSKRKLLEKKCRHLLYSNREYLRFLKTSSPNSLNFQMFERTFFESLPSNIINEEKWIKKMKKLISSSK